MWKPRRLRVILVFLSLIVLSAKPSRSDDGFQRRALSLLQSRCLACHGGDPEKIRGALDLRTRAGLLEGGESGEPAIVPGAPEESRLYIAVTRRDAEVVMPPKANDRLSPDEVEAIRRWIADGAPWTVADSIPPPDADGVKVATTGGRTPDWTDRHYEPAAIWAFQPITVHDVPSSDMDSNPIHNPIDAWIQRALRDRGITRTAPPAAPGVLLRRLTFDLTGLPPSLAEATAFLDDHRRDPRTAIARLIERLLASPRYGEQAARHWLDVVRYADSAGFSNDFERPNAWRYRDYVVRAFNQDRPFDRFVIEQLAGDELDADDPELQIATGFLRMGPWEHTSMSVAAETRQQFLDDVTQSVGVTFLGQALRCARCHDHKFDPVPTVDYYRLQAIFAPLQFTERPAPFLPSENTASFGANLAAIESRLAVEEAELRALRAKNAAAIAAYLKERGVARAEELPEAERPNKRFYGLTSRERSLWRIIENRADALKREAQRYEAQALGVYSGPSRLYDANQLRHPLPKGRDGFVEAVHVLNGGGLESPAEEVGPGVLSALGIEGAIPGTTDGRRLAFARWVVRRDNPLTARVIVNRVWQRHFGRGLVATPNNFGTMGARPSHPELLDWLANWFMDQGWSLKALDRLILNSASYQRSGTAPDGDRLRQVDPNLALLAAFPPRRLDAEEIRDAMLAVTGELNSALGGPANFPEIHWEIAFQPRHTMGSIAPAYQPSRTPAERNRRTLYASRQRTLADPMLEVFNRPGSELACDRRDETTVAPQAFALFNGAFAHDRALALAVDLERTPGNPCEQAIRRVYGRAATAEESRLGSAHVERMTAYHREHPPQRVEPPRSVKRRMVEEMTGEEYEWLETLDRMTDYQSDLKPWDVPPATRALADFCLVLMNSNEFLYVR